MIVEKITVKGGNIVYRISADVKETSGNCPHEIARFDDLETAVLVMKYMRGDRMPEADQKYAKEAIKRL